MRHLSPSRKRRGFTLMEILIVIALLATVIAIAARQYGTFTDQGSEQATRLKFTALEAPLFAYQQKYGSYPTTEQGLQALVDAKYEKTLPKDGWNRPLCYRYPGEKNKGSYDIWSLGSDGIESEDDFGNWEQTQPR